METVFAPDVKLAFDPDRLVGDVAVEEGDLVAERALETAVVVSLFSDRRAQDGDRLPGSETDRRGYWGDAYWPDEGDRIGSRLWLLSRELETDEVLDRAKTYAEEALAWMVEDGVASAVEVLTEVTRPGILGMEITIVRPDGSRLPRRFDLLWEGLV